MPRLTGILACVMAGAAAGAASGGEPHDAPSPNVVMIAIDDLNDWVGCLGGHPDVKTPNIDRLARRGLLFTNAHCHVPVCMASRVALMSGKMASTTGCYEFNAEFHEAPALAGDVPLPKYFKQHGYETVGGGKLLHGAFEGRVADSWDDDWGRRLCGGPKPPQLMNWTNKTWDFGPYPATDEEMGDHRLAQRAAAYLRDTHNKPFFLACGFAKPHVSWHVPPKWFDLYDRDTIALPKAPPEDMDDVPVNAVTTEKRVAPTHQEVLDSGKWRDFVQAYLATVSFVDSCVGIVADAVENGPNKENTIVILWSDHGFHLGEKQHWAKRRLWEESTRTPLIIAGPGIAPGTATDGAASLIDVFPTLIDLCGLPAKEGFDGVSLVPLIRDPASPWDRAVVSTWTRNNHAVRDRHWRYIRYEDGAEELYDHAADPDEWCNLASDPDHAAVKQRLAKSLPASNAPYAEVVREKKSPERKEKTRGGGKAAPAGKKARSERTKRDRGEPGRKK